GDDRPAPGRGRPGARALGTRAGRAARPEDSPMTPGRALLPAVIACVLAGGCTIPPVCRADEKARVEQVVASRTEALGLSADRVLAMADCEAIAVRNNLEYRVTLLETKLADEDVNAAFAGLFPQGTATFTKTTRSNEPLVFGTTGIPGSFEDKNLD